MRESLTLMRQCLDFLTYWANENIYDYIIDDNKLVPPSRGFMKHSMNLLFIILSYILKDLLFLMKILILLLKLQKVNLVFT